MKTFRVCCPTTTSEDHTVACETRSRMSALKQRPEDQPLPVPNDRPFIAELVMEDIRKRMELGISRYGVALQPHNGRDVEQDIYEELLDAACYMRQKIYERDHPKEKNQ